MKNCVKNSLIFSVLLSFLLLSCTKDKSANTNPLENTTTTKGKGYELDTKNSQIEWKGYKVLKSENTSHFGSILFSKGNFTVNNGQLESGNFIADMNSLTSIDLKDNLEYQTKLDGHLKSADFFDVEKHPTASFEITKIEAVNAGDFNTKLSGNLTIKGVSQPIEILANVVLKPDGLQISTEPKDINREDFGVQFQSPIENGVIKNEVTLQVSVNAIAKN